MSNHQSDRTASPALRRARSRRAAAAIAWALLALAQLALGSARAVPLETYGRLPALEDVSLSPDGSRIALVQTVGDERVIAAVSLVDGKPMAIMKIGDVRVRQVAWADDRHLLITMSKTLDADRAERREYEIPHIALYDVQTKETLPVPDASAMGYGRSLFVTGNPMVRRIDGKTVIFVSCFFAGSPAFPLIARYDVESRESSVWVRGSDSIRAWLLDDRGAIAAQEYFAIRESHWVVKILKDGSYENAAEGIEPIDIPSFLGFGPDGGTVLLREPNPGGVSVRVLPLHPGATLPVLGDGRPFDMMLYDRLSGRITGGIRVDDDAHYVFFDPKVQRRWASVVQAFEGARVQFASASEDFRKWAVRVEGPAFGYRYQLIDFDTHKSAPLGDVYPGVTEPYEVRRITYKARDGMAIPAYLTLPRGPSAKSLPLVVLPHGGPATRDTADFDWWSQALADQGYAVLRSNYRGSAVSAATVTDGYGQYGRKMQSDLSDGVRYLVSEGIVDPARVCIVGASYGGYAALAGVTLEPGVYRCAVSVAGLSDLRAFLHWIDKKSRIDDFPELGYWKRFMGTSGIDDPVLSQLSPLRNIDAVKVPILLIHGHSDTVVPYAQSQSMYDALKAAGKDVKFVTLDGEDHWLSHGATRIQMLRETVGFLRDHNPPGLPDVSGITTPQAR
jgi:dipeptidyl aminopeptidase/acylaminoacyl peptidase